MPILRPEEHWDAMYRTRRPDEMSWFRPHLDASLALIRQTRVPLDAPVIDVGAGASSLIEDLLEAGFEDITALDVSSAALDLARKSLGARSAAVTWIAADVTRTVLPPHHFRLWHDRAVFHFLSDPTDRDRYVAQVRDAVAPGGYVIIGAFGPEGPQRCSGLPTDRYSAETLHAAFGNEFQLLERREEHHVTPVGIDQQFMYCL